MITRGWRGRINPPAKFQDSEMHRKNLVALSLILLSSIHCFSQSATIGTVRLVLGRVMIERAGRELPVRIGTEIHIQDTVKTGSDAKLTVELLDTGFVNITETIELTLSN